MRFLIHARIPTEDGNKMVQDPNFLRKLETYINKVKAEATYFFEANGNRIAALYRRYPECRPDTSLG